MSDSNGDSKSRPRETRCCAIYTCENKRVGKKDNSGLSFHRFPKDPIIRKAWIRRCCISDDVNLDCATICSEHFEFDDFERSYQKQLMGIERRPILKKNVIPHRKLPPPELKYRVKNRFYNLTKSNNTASNIPAKKDEVEMKTIEVSCQEELPPIESVIPSPEPVPVQKADVNSNSPNITNLLIENVEIEPDYKTSYLLMLENYETLKAEKVNLEKELTSEKERVREYEAILTKIFSEGEIHLLSSVNNK